MANSVGKQEPTKHTVVKKARAPSSAAELLVRISEKMRIDDVRFSESGGFCFKMFSKFQVIICSIKKDQGR